MKGSGRWFSVTTRTLAGSVPLSSGTLTVPTVPACTSQRRNVSGAIQRRMFAINSGVASSYFIEARTGLKSDTTIFGVPGRATTSGPSAASATAMSPAAGLKISADSSSTSFVRRPAPSAVSGRHRSSFTLRSCVSRTGIGEPSAGGSIQMEFRVRATGGAKRSSTTMSAFTADRTLPGGSKTASTCGFDGEQRAQHCGSAE